MLLIKYLQGQPIHLWDLVVAALQLSYTLLRYSLDAEVEFFQAGICVAEDSKRALENRSSVLV